MSQFSTDSSVTRYGRWLALGAALLGWMFDGMEMGLFPLVARPALGELLGLAPGEGLVSKWYGIVMAAFLIGAATGGVVFGWLGDKIGRVRAMTFSVLTYSLCSGLSAASTNPGELAALRFLGALGMGGEWALGVALVMEVWPNASRAWLAGWIGAFGNLGYTVCGLIAIGLNRVGGELPGWLTGIGLPEGWVATLTAHERWRLLMLLGAVPAMLTMFIRLFVPESEKWEREKETGAASHWSGRDLVGVMIGVAAAGGVIVLWARTDIGRELQILGSLAGMVVVTLGYLYPARQYLSRCGLSESVRRQTLGRMVLAAGLSGVPLLATWSGVMWMYQWVGKLPGGTDPDARAVIQISSSLGAMVGCVVGAVLGGKYGRRLVYAALCVLSMVIVVGFYQLNTEYGPAFIASAGLMGAVTAAFYGWLPLYLPELFPTAVRATGQGFGFNFGRIIAAAGNLQMSALLAVFDNDYAKACAVVPAVYGVGLLLIAIAPETKGKPLPE
ncbi:MFS transporter [Fimbriiglobus ruber]|uniref:4-hydroxybenzoate transporter n=1 Tax=Fimbriiglobus ruber TaxID=1908690 RepID=A0A225D4Q7_9BACT|nr:MFS transporter [Fimbriiglobus ruber]OWK36560.1 4-hydroxybenzoate transporter [Fimbriiglobus ruber]